MENSINKKLKAFKVFSIAVILLGIVLLIYMVTVESEPGLLPLLLILTGTASYFYFRAKTSKKNS